MEAKSSEKLLIMTQTKLELALERETNSSLQLERTKTLLETSQQNEEHLKAQLKLCKANETALNLEFVRVKTLLETSQQNEENLKQNEENLKVQLKSCKANETALNLELVVTQQRESKLSNQIRAQEINGKQKSIDNFNNISQSLKQLQEDHVSFENLNISLNPLFYSNLIISLGTLYIYMFTSNAV
jgi:hypothetical protein